MSIFLQISRHRRNHSQHVLKDVIPPLEQLVSDSFPSILCYLSSSIKWVTPKLNSSKQCTWLSHVFVSQESRHGLAESPSSESLKRLFEPESRSSWRLDRGSIFIHMVVGGVQSLQGYWSEAAFSSWPNGLLQYDSLFLQSTQVWTGKESANQMEVEISSKLIH